MCLHKVTERRRSKNDDMVVGYKVFWVENHQMRGEFYGGPYSKGVTYNADTVGSIREYGTSYQKGFHIFTTLEGARLWTKNKSPRNKIYEVHGWDIRAVGKQGYSGVVVVAKHMRIIRRVK